MTSGVGPPVGAVWLGDPVAAGAGLGAGGGDAGDVAGKNGAFRSVDGPIGCSSPAAGSFVDSGG